MGIFGSKKEKKVAVLTSDYLQSTCEIKSMENELICTGRLAEITSEYMRIEKKNVNLTAMRTGKHVKINVFNTKKGFRVILGTVFTSTEEFAKITDIVELTDRDKRQFFRVNLELTAFAYEKGDMDTARKIPIFIHDMSLSGIRIEMDPPPEIGDVIWIELNLQGRAYCCQCRVIRRIPVMKAIRESFGEELREDAKKAIESGESDYKIIDKKENAAGEKSSAESMKLVNPSQNDNTKNDTQIYEYGCSFLFSETDDTDPLCSFLFKVQGEELQRIRNKNTDNY